MTNLDDYEGMNTIITLPCYGIVVELGPVDAETPGASRGGALSSDLKEGLGKRRTCLKSALDAVESLILAMACAGVDIETPAMIEAIETCVEAIWNNLD